MDNLSELLFRVEQMYSKLRILAKILCPYFSLSMFIKLVNFLEK